LRVRKEGKLHEKQYFAKQMSTTTKMQSMGHIYIFCLWVSQNTGFQDSLESLSPLTNIVKKKFNSMSSKLSTDVLQKDHKRKKRGEKYVCVFANCISAIVQLIFWCLNL